MATIYVDRYPFTQLTQGHRPKGSGLAPEFCDLLTTRSELWSTVIAPQVLDQVGEVRYGSLLLQQTWVSSVVWENCTKMWIFCREPFALNSQRMDEIEFGVLFLQRRPCTTLNINWV